ncbi:type VI secretion system protein TssA [Reyranella sp.]|jgi:type VI secretion system protein ImpA|uniref:type VI secretion system protein TssA n=1 Tax=Reyranella sp. TaxID=1929291 RepID=UPI002F95305C
MIPELETADLEAILAPLAGDQPTGADLRQDYTPNSIYFRLRDARAGARDAERQAETREGDDEGQTALWRPVAALAIGALKSNSKDLEVATWLTEALVRTAGLRGLAAGASVIAGLTDRYWEGVFPMPDEHGMETRLAAVAGLSGQGADGTLMQPLRKTILFRRPDGSPFSVWQYQATLELSAVSDPARRAQRVEAGVMPFDDVEKEARLAGAAHWSAQRDMLAEAIASWKEMERVLDEKAGQASPSGNRVRELLQLMLEISSRFAPQDAATDRGAASNDGASAGNGAAPMSAPGSIGGREQALQQLADVAAWFKRNEPNSPIGFTLDEAARRARLAWPELVAELVSDETARQALLTSAGMKRPEEQQPQ